MSDRIPETITLDRTGKPPLRFAGTLLTQASGQFVNTKPDKPNDNWWQIAIYQTENGFVVAITYHNEHRGQYAHRQVDVADNPAEPIERYDPLAVLQGFPPGEPFAARQADLERRSRRQWETVASAVLAGFPEEITSTHAPAVVEFAEQLRRQIDRWVEDGTADQRNGFQMCVRFREAIATVLKN